MPLVYAIWAVSWVFVGSFGCSRRPLFHVEHDRRGTADRMHIRTRMGWPCTGERLISAILRTSPPPNAAHWA